MKLNDLVVFAKTGREDHGFDSHLGHGRVHDLLFYFPA
jgi:hypothetical protein